MVGWVVEARYGDQVRYDRNIIYETCHKYQLQHTIDALWRTKWLPCNDVDKNKTYLTHVRNVKQRGLAVGAAPQVLLHDASVLAALVQDRKLVTREGHHVTAELLVKVVESGLSEGFIRGSSGEGALGHRSAGG